MAFDILSLQRNRGQQAPQDQPKSKAEEQEGRAELKYLDVFDVVPSEDNFYSMSAIEDLAGLIELAGGVKEPGVAVPLGGGKYKAIAGHRRRAACILLVERGEEKYRLMPFMVEPQKQEEPQDAEEAAEAEELRKIDEQIILIATNGQREKTDWDKVQEATRLRDLLARKRKLQRVPGKTREIIARQLGTTPAQVGRYESIEKHLLPEFKEEMQAERVNVSVGYELSVSSERVQKEALEEYRRKGTLAIDDVKRLRLEEERAEPLPGQIQFGGGTAEAEEPKSAEVAPEEESAEGTPQDPEPAEKAEPEEVKPKEGQQPVPPKAPEPATVAGTTEPPAHLEPQETRCIDGGICPYCGERFDAAELVNYSIQGTQHTSPVPCPTCGKPIKIFCSVEYFCSPTEE